MYIIYFLVICFSTSIGALSGIGGGVIIKPALDYLNYSNLENISFYSSASVGLMAAVSIYNRGKKGNLLPKSELFYIMISSIIGGKLGQFLFNYYLHLFNNQEKLRFIQIIITIILLTFSLIYTSFHKYVERKSNNIILFLMCLTLSTISVFLGIGGGPINVAIFALITGMEVKNSTLYSITLIFFAQSSKIFNEILINDNLAKYNLIPLLVILPAAIIGGIIGTKLNISLSNNTIKNVYMLVTIFVILLNFINSFKLFY